jgi:four helix bundle protein
VHGRLQKFESLDESSRVDVSRLQTACVFPRDEIYGLTSQKRRASASIGANIAEGCGRRSDPEMKCFIQIARGSAGELECHLLLARDLQFFTIDEFEELEPKILEIERMLASLAQRLQKSVLAGSQELEAGSFLP